MKVHQVVFTVVDFDRLGADGVRETLESTRFPNDCMHVNVRSVETREIGDWDDDHPLNRRDTAEAELCRLFGAMPLPAPAQAQSDELARLRNLLAVIHGDGGHYTAEHGLPKSADDAANIVHELRAKLAEAEQAARERGEALRVYADVQRRIAYIDEWVAAGMPPGELPEMPEWAQEGRGDG